MKQVTFDNGGLISKQSPPNIRKSNNDPQFIVLPSQVGPVNADNDFIHERSQKQSSKYSLAGDMAHGEARNSLHNMDLMEYYQKMKPERGFAALIIGRPMSIEEVRLTTDQIKERSRSSSPSDKIKGI
jgi:hypothetical protein